MLDFFASVADRVLVDRDFYSVLITKKGDYLEFTQMQQNPDDHSFDRYFEAILEIASEYGLYLEGSHE